MIFDSWWENVQIEKCLNRKTYSRKISENELQFSCKKLETVWSEIVKIGKRQNRKTSNRKIAHAWKTAFGNCRIGKRTRATLSVGPYLY